MNFSSILIANRGEIAIRIARAAADLGIHTVSIFGPDDASSLHVRTTDKAYALPGRGPSRLSRSRRDPAGREETGCDAIHPGYGFLSEDAAFAQECADHNIIFIGPTPETLLELGDKSRARNLARTLGVPLVPGSLGPVSLDEGKIIRCRDRPGRFGHDQGRRWRRRARHARGPFTEMKLRTPTLAVDPRPNRRSAMVMFISSAFCAAHAMSKSRSSATDAT